MIDIILPFESISVVEKNSFCDTEILFANKEPQSPLVQQHIDAMQFLNGSKDVLIKMTENSEEIVLEGACCFSLLTESPYRFDKIEIYELFRYGDQSPSSSEAFLRQMAYSQKKAVDLSESSSDEICFSTSEYVVGQPAEAMLALSREVGDAFNHEISYEDQSTASLKLHIFARDSFRNDHQITLHEGLMIGSVAQIISDIRSLISKIPNSSKMPGTNLYFVY